jgi:hypothetical protein
MKTRYLLVACVLGLTLNAQLFSQQTAPPPTKQLRNYDTTATISWDSLFLGTASDEKLVEVLNDGAVKLTWTYNNDTGAHAGWVLKAGEFSPTLRSNSVGWIRVKCASGTCAFRLVWTH